MDDPADVPELRNLARPPDGGGRFLFRASEKCVFISEKGNKTAFRRVIVVMDYLSV